MRVVGVKKIIPRAMVCDCCGHVDSLLFIETMGGVRLVIQMREDTARALLAELPLAMALPIEGEDGSCEMPVPDEWR